METKNQPEKVYFEDLEKGEIFQINFDEIREDNKQYEKKVIHAPDDFTFDQKPLTAILDGFTEGAEKNILSLSKQKIRLYKVTLESIKLLSCSEISSSEIRDALSRNIFERNTLIQEPKIKLLGRIRFISTTAEELLTLKFDIKTGELLEAEISNFESKSSVIFNLCTVPPFKTPKNSIKDSYLEVIIPEKLWFQPLTNVEIVKVRGSHIKRWFNFDSTSKALLSTGKAKFNNKVFNLPQELKSGWIYTHDVYTRTFNFGQKNHNFAVLCVKTPQTLVFKLIDLRKRKVLRSASIDLIDILGEERMKRLWREDVEFIEGLEEDQRGIGEGTKGIELYDFNLVPNTSSALFVIRFRNFEVKARIEDLFDKKTWENAKLTKYRKNGLNNILKRFGKDKILTYYSGPIKSTYVRPLAWLDPISLEEIKLNGFEENEDYSLMNFKETNNKATTEFIQLSETRLLILNDCFIFIYDFEQGEVIAKKLYTFKQVGYSKFINIDDIYIKNTQGCIFILKTRRDEAGSEVVQHLKSIHPNDHLDNIFSRAVNQSYEYSFFKLANGNYLYVGATEIEAFDRINPNKTTEVGISIEIDASTLEVVNFHQGSLREFFDETRFVADNVHLVDKFLLFSTKLIEAQLDIQQEGGVEAEGANRLILIDLDFNILSFCKHSRLSNKWPIKVASSDNKILSIGIENQIYLHKVDLEAQKLVLLKTLTFKSATIINYKSLFYNPSFFVCFISSNNDISETEGQEDPSITLLIFDQDLRLRSSLKIQNFPKFNWTYAVSESQFVYSTRDNDSQGQVIKLVDLNQRSVGIAGFIRGVSSTPNYLVDDFGGSGPGSRNLLLELTGEAISKIYFD